MFSGLHSIIHPASSVSRAISADLDIHKARTAAISSFGGPEITFSTNMVIAAHASVKAAMPSLVPSLKISQVPKTTRLA
jgi:hypothetical protein